MRRIVGVMAVALACGHIAEAQVSTYSSRADWSAATGAFIQTEDLNGFGSDTSFQGTVVPLLNMAITQLGGPPGNAPVNFIDVPPFEEDGKRSIDGTAYVLGEVDDNGTVIRIAFTAPVSGWGADFVSHDAAAVVDVFDEFGNLLGTTAPVALDTTFYGFHLAAGQRAGHIDLRFAGVFNDLFGMDNLSFIDLSAPPDPAALTLSLAASVNAITPLQDGQITSLVRKLDAVLGLVSNEQGRAGDNPMAAAVGVLHAFVREVQALAGRGALPSGVSQALIAHAAAISALLTAPPQ